MAARDQLRLEIDLSSRLENLDLVDLVTEALLRHLGLNDQSVERLGLAIREAAANGVCHGNAEDPEKRVRMSYLANRQEIAIQIVDEGKGFDPESLPDPTDPKNLFKPRGRGILLIRSFMDETDFDFDTDLGTKLTLRKRITPEMITSGAEKEDEK